MAAGWQIQFLEASGDLSSERPAICRAIDRAWDLISAITPPPSLDILVQRDPARVITELGVGGFNLSEHLIWLKLDPDNPACADSLASDQFTRLVTHEVHHALRQGSVGLGGSLAEALVFEGLAGRFTAAIHGSDGELWDRAIDDAMLAEHHPSDDELASTNFDYNEWFYGAAERPRWLGYALGFQMAGAWVAADPKMSLDQMISVPTQDVISAWAGASMG